ncbi:Glyoxalase-like domain protein [Tsuneonella dongtanensis]|uniref:Glyoxalase-like domain protein n=1 Tax=Tsuneonella dongtanensis TaxID=692370 RepID=A0A1B2A912_9SPHN|nr:VOC family protein [Tsuneonella dongtanensis]ANY18636.1 Glyoxalase-like domain protein [Tsuneonella dongtanensis]
MSVDLSPFHVAFPVHDIAAARAFYGGTMGLAEGRSDDAWVDFDLFGHQIVAHLDPNLAEKRQGDCHHNPVDGHDVPVPHFGVVLDMERFSHLADRLRDEGVEFVIEPYIRFAGEVGEQATMFFLDPSGNALEFKAFKDRSQLFAT